MPKQNQLKRNQHGIKRKYVWFALLLKEQLFYELVVVVIIICHSNYILKEKEFSLIISLFYLPLMK